MSLIGTTLILTAAIGSLVFLLDYFRTVDIKLPFARLVIALNVAMSGALWVSFLRRVHIVEIEPTRLMFWAMLLLLNIALWAQVYLLHQSRK